MPKFFMRALYMTLALSVIALSLCMISILPAFFSDASVVMAHPGTPEPDRDGDGITDDLDACPDTPGPFYMGGCPDPNYEANVRATAQAQQQPLVQQAAPTAVAPTAAPNPVTARTFPQGDTDAVRAALQNGAVSLEAPLTLSSADGTPSDIIRELQTLGEIPAGGALRLELPFMFLSGRGDLFLGLASGAPSQNLVISADLLFNANPFDDQTLEICSLAARAERDSNRNALAMLDVALINNGGIAVIDRAAQGDEAAVTAVSLRVDAMAAQHVIAVVQDDTVDVYLNGERILDDVQVTPRSGTYGLTLVGRGATLSPRCEANNFWLYTYE
jgi:hypothetical protein